MLARIHLADVRHGNDRVAQMRAHLAAFRDILARAEARKPLDPHNLRWRLQVVVARHRCAMALVGLARAKVDREANLAAAGRYLAPAREEVEAMARQFPSSFAVARQLDLVHGGIEQWHRARGEREAAWKVCRQRTEARHAYYERRRKEAPDNLVWSYHLARSYRSASNDQVAFDQDEPVQRAIDSARKAVELAGRLVARDRASVPWTAELVRAHDARYLALTHSLDRRVMAAAPKDRDEERRKTEGLPEFEESLASFDEALRLRQHLARLQPHRPDWLRQVAQGHRTWVDFHRRRKDVGADAAYARYVATIEALDAAFPREARRDPFDQSAPRTTTSVVLGQLFGDPARLRNSLRLGLGLSWYRPRPENAEGFLEGLVKLVARAGATPEEQREARWALRCGLALLHVLREEKALPRPLAVLQPPFEARLAKPAGAGRTPWIGSHGPPTRPRCCGSPSKRTRGPWTGPGRERKGEKADADSPFTSPIRRAKICEEVDRRERTFVPGGARGSEGRSRRRAFQVPCARKACGRRFAKGFTQDQDKPCRSNVSP